LTFSKKEKGRKREEGPLNIFLKENLVREGRDRKGEERGGGRKS